jgi:hypothetical protein
MFNRPVKFADDGVITPIPPGLDLSPSYSALERPITTSSAFDGNRFDRHVKDDCPDTMPSLVVGGDDMWMMIAHIISYWGFLRIPMVCSYVIFTSACPTIWTNFADQP